MKNTDYIKKGWSGDCVSDFDNNQAEFFLKVLKVAGIFLLVGIIGILLVVSLVK